MKLNKIISICLFVFSVNALSQSFGDYEPIPPQEPRKPGLSDAELKTIEEQWPTLYGGRPIKAGELRPSVYIGNCTATVIGPEVILTAAHCRSTGSSASFTFERKRYSGKCTRHPQYSKNGWLNNDWAFCKFSPPLEMDKYGSLKKHVVEVGDIVTMQGYGRGSNGVLNVGEAIVGKKDNMDYITKGKVYLGGGDSGGALFKQVEDLVNGPFYIIGVNSRGSRGGVSYFNQAELDRSQAWFADYAEDQGVDICGINKDCYTTPKPPKPPVPAGCEDEAKDYDFLQAKADEAKFIVEQCRASKVSL